MIKDETKQVDKSYERKELFSNLWVCVRML